MINIYYIRRCVQWLVKPRWHTVGYKHDIVTRSWSHPDAIFVVQLSKTTRRTCWFSILTAAYIFSYTISVLPKPIKNEVDMYEASELVAAVCSSRRQLRKWNLCCLGYSALHSRSCSSSLGIKRCTYKLPKVLRLSFAGPRRLNEGKQREVMAVDDL